MNKKLLLLVVLSPLLFAFQCNEDDHQFNEYRFNKFKVNASPETNLALGDTLWISGRVSTKFFDVTTNDSVMSVAAQTHRFSLSKFTNQATDYNTKDAIDKFEIVNELGTNSFLNSCENSVIYMEPVLSANGTSYHYTIGFKALETGDYIIHFDDSILTNTITNLMVVENYPLVNHPNQIVFNSCDVLTYQDLSTSERDYIFTVE